MKSKKPPQGQGLISQESILNFYRADIGRRIVGIINIDSGEVFLAAGATTNIPPLRNEANAKWVEVKEKNGLWQEASLGSGNRDVGDSQDFLRMSRPKPPRKYPHPALSQSISKIKGSHHFPLVHVLDNMSDRFGHEPATVHNQLVRMLGFNKEDFLGFSFFKTKMKEVTIKYSSGTLNRDKCGGTVIQDPDWKMFIAGVLLFKLNVEKVSVELGPVYEMRGTDIMVSHPPHHEHPLQDI